MKKEIESIKTEINSNNELQSQIVIILPGLIKGESTRRPQRWEEGKEKAQMINFSNE